jgi:hypothetical protein
MINDLWYKNAIVYCLSVLKTLLELRVIRFFDQSGSARTICFSA